MNTVCTPRRSPRLAEKAVKATLVVAPAAVPETIMPVIAAPKPKADPREPKYTPAIKGDRRVRTTLLEEAKVIRHQLGRARTPDDFAACSMAADMLWRQATSRLQNRGADEMFLSDCCHWLGWGKAPVLGRVAHQWAIRSIKSYIKCLEGRIRGPYSAEYEDR
jgi:hypothetical protein